MIKFCKLFIILFTFACSINKPVLPTPIPKPTATIKPKEVPVKTISNDNNFANNRRKILLIESTDIQRRELKTLSRTQNVNWAPYDVKAFKQASKENKIVFLFIKSNNIIECKELEENILNEKKISNILNRNFIPVKTDLNENKADLPDQLTENDLPLLVFFTPTGELIGVLSGKISISRLNLILLRLSL